MKRTFLGSITRSLLGDPVVGVLAGCALGILAWTGLGIWIEELPRPFWIVFVAVAASAGCAIGILHQGPPGRGRTVAWWCVAMTWIVGGTGFLVGFVGPLIFAPSSNQGPLLGIFVTGPLGAIAGAVSGVVIGLFVRNSAADSAKRHAEPAPGHLMPAHR